jgi:hypothetical protein
MISENPNLTTEYRHRSWPVSKSHALNGTVFAPWKGSRIVGLTRLPIESALALLRPATMARFLVQISNPYAWTVVLMQPLGEDVERLSHCGAQICASEF